MLPKNALRKARLRKLRLYAGDEHEFMDTDLLPIKMPLLWKERKRGGRGEDESTSSDATLIRHKLLKEKYGISLPDAASPSTST